MEPVAIVTALLGALYIVGRGPLIVAPGRTVAFYRRLFSTPVRIRPFGGFFLLFGVAMVETASEAPAALVDTTSWIEGFGWFVALVTAALLVVPGLFQKLVYSFWDATSNRAIRSFGVLSVAFGLFLCSVAFFKL